MWFNHHHQFQILRERESRDFRKNVKKSFSISDTRRNHKETDCWDLDRERESRDFHFHSNFTHKKMTALKQWMIYHRTFHHTFALHINHLIFLNTYLFGMSLLLNTISPYAVRIFLLDFTLTSLQWIRHSYYIYVYLYLPSISSYSLTNSHAHSSNYAHLRNARSTDWRERRVHTQIFGWRRKLEIS